MASSPKAREEITLFSLVNLLTIITEPFCGNNGVIALHPAYGKGPDKIDTCN